MNEYQWLRAETNLTADITFKPIYKREVEIYAGSTLVADLTNKVTNLKVYPTMTVEIPTGTNVKINTKLLGIKWELASDYRIEFDEGFTQEGSGVYQKSLPKSLSFTTSLTPPFITEIIPAAGSTDTVNNTTVTINFDRKVKVLNEGNIYFYQKGTTDTLLKSFSISDLIGIDSVNSIVLDVKGLLKAATSYYILTDANILKDVDRFVLPQVTSPTQLSYTTADEPNFHGLISIELSFGSFYAVPVATRRTTKSLASVATLFTYIGKLQKAVFNRQMVVTITDQVSKIARFRPKTISSAFSVLTNNQIVRVSSASISSAMTLVASVLKFKRTESNLNVVSTLSIPLTYKYVRFSWANPASSTTFGRQNRFLVDAYPYKTVDEGWHYIIPNPQNEYPDIYTDGLETQPDIFSTTNRFSHYPYFGRTAALTSNYIITSNSILRKFGSEYMDDLSEQCCLFVYNKNKISGVRKINNPNYYNIDLSAYLEGGPQQNSFGTVLVSNNSYIATSAPREGPTLNVNGDVTNPYGVVYVFNVSDGSIKYTIPNPSTSSSNYGFGSTLSISTNYLAIGNDGSNVYVYNLSDGSLKYTFSNPSTAGTGFGSSIAITNNHLVVSHLRMPTGGYATVQGKVYIYELVTGTLLYTINNPVLPSEFASTNPGAWYTEFGLSVAANSNYVLIGSPGAYSTSGSSSGSAYETGFPPPRAYIVNLTTGLITSTLSNPNTYGSSNLDMFGYSIAMNSTYAFISAPNEGDTTYPGAAGNVYMYDLTTQSLQTTINGANQYTGTLADNYWSVDSLGFKLACDESCLIIPGNLRRGRNDAKYGYNSGLGGELGGAGENGGLPVYRLS